MPKQSVLRESFQFEVSALIDLFSLDGSPIGLNTVYKFCNGTNTNFQPVVYGGITYTPFPLEMTDVSTDGKGQISRPKITLSNINGFVSSLLLENSQLTGAIVTRTRVFARFLDASNWAGIVPNWVTPDPTASFEPEVFYVNRKITENPQVVSFELASILDVQNVKLPRRQILANTCQFRYRDSMSCTYDGAPVADSSDRTFAGDYGYTLSDQGAFDIGTTYNQGDYVYIYSSLPQFSGIKVYYVCSTNGTVGITPQGNPSKWIPDSCSKTCAGCKLRFTDVPLRTSAFPGVARAPFIARA